MSNIIEESKVKTNFCFIFFYHQSSMNDPNRNEDDVEGDSSIRGDQLLEEFRQQWKQELQVNLIKK